MRRPLGIAIVCLMSVTVSPVFSQQIDVAFGGGSTSAPGSYNATSSSAFTQGLGGGAYVGFGGDVLIKRNFGVEGELFWRASQGSYGGQIPYRPLFWDFNGIYTHPFNKYLTVEGLAGIGAESVRFYGGTPSCDIYGNCTNYVSSNHFMGDLGGGVRLYAYRNFFVRPEVRLYLVHNNVEFSSGCVVHYGVSIGYTFGGSR